MNASFRSRLGVAAGTGFEVYDFITYTYFSASIGAAFFPASTPFLSLMGALVAFGAGFLSRPLGGLAFGFLADRVGRRGTLIATFLLMSGGLALLVLTPPFSVIGWAAPCLIVLARLLQGLAFGGEIGPAASFMVEGAPPGSRGFSISLMSMMSALATLLAGFSGAIAALILSKPAMAAFGWRIVMGLGLGLLPLVLLARRSLPETFDRTAALSAPPPLRSVRRITLVGFVLIGCASVHTYISSYLVTYGVTVFKVRQSDALLGVAVSGLIGALAAPLVGKLSDRWGRLTFIRPAWFSMTVLSIPALTFVHDHHDLLGMALYAFGVTCLGLGNAIVLAWLAESLPMARRAVATGGVYALAVTLLGAGSQPAMAWLLHATGDWRMFGYVLTVISGIAAFTTMFMDETAPRAKGVRARPTGRPASAAA